MSELQPTANAPESDPVYQQNLSNWQELVKRTFTISQNRPDDSGDFWIMILNNTIPQNEIERQMAVIESLGGRHLKGNGYRACVLLSAYREVGIFPYPIEKDA